MKKIEQIGLNRLNLISVGKASRNSTSAKLKMIFLSELANLGFRVTNPEIFNNSALDNYDEILATVTAMKGGDVDYVPLFSGFPENVPEKEEFFTKRVIGYFGNLLGMFDENDGKVMDNGLVVPEFLFDLTEFGADPILGRQSKELYEAGLENQKARKSDDHTEWTYLTFSENVEEEVQQFLANNLYAKSSIKEALKEDIDYLIEEFGLDFITPKKVVFKEIKSFIMSYLWNKSEFDTLSKYADTPTDILRMLAALSESDISLATPITFGKFSRPQRRFILENLNGFTDLAENLNVYKGLWLELGRFLHPGEYKARYTNTYEAFDLLRNGKVITFNSQVEKDIEDRDLNSLLGLLSSRPGIFGRKIHQVLEIFEEDVDKVLDNFKKISSKLELKNLLILESYFKTIEDADYKSIINKKGSVVIIPNKPGRVKTSVIDNLLEIIQNSINTKLAEKKILVGKKVWIHPDLRNYTIPLQQRKMSDGLLNIGRGSRIKFEDGKVLRMFTYWKQAEGRTDLDLSLIEFDKDMNFQGQVSYTNLSEGGIKHSGDITSAPHGAAEFIDVTLDKVKKEARYLGIQIYKYAGENFSQLEKSYAGWMIRDKATSSYKSFDIKTVQNKFNVVGKGGYAIPMVVDLKTREIIFIDMYMGGRGGEYGSNRNEGAVQDVSIVTKELVKMIDTRPNMLDLVTYHAKASKAQIVEEKEDADVTFGITDCTYEVGRVDEILSELL